MVVIFMANIMDYLDWRGDLSLTEVPFNEVDNLVLSTLSYFDFADIVPSLGSLKEITIKEAINLYFEKKRSIKGLILNISNDFLVKLTNAPRFNQAKLSCYINMIDESYQVQFSAIKMRLSDDSFYIAFRGTDDTIIGWKEDFTMTYEVTPSQKMACYYLKKVVLEDGNYRLGGHSKGGNLAVYASLHANWWIQAKIKNIYSNDGPGLSYELIDQSIYNKMKPKIIKFVPSYDIVGMLFEKQENVTIINSNQNGILQHSILSWQVTKDRLVRKDDFEKESKIINTAIKEWLDDLDFSKRKQIIDDLFSEFLNSGYETLLDVANSSERFSLLIHSLIKTRKARQSLVNSIKKEVIDDIKNEINQRK